MTTKIEQPISMFDWELINDLAALPENEEMIIDFLLERLQHGQIYTWIGSVLLTINPNNEISTSHLYNLSEFDKYLNSTEAVSGVPHIYTVAARAHYSLTRELGRNCQVIIISGATGTGKTFNACKCLEFLSRINKNEMLAFQGDYTYNIVLRIMDACRLISAFTTACTERNEVSSRHGQLVCLHYKGSTISGATINSFLLERSRVTRGSNNFQIFYQMMFGMSSTELESYNLSTDECYDILSTVDCNKIKYFQNSFQDTSKALDILGFTSDQKRNIFQVLALLLHMGNIKFIQSGETCTIDINDKKSMKALKSTCALSSLTEEAVIELLTTILINPQSTWRKHTPYHRYLVTVDACRSRLHSIIRHMYELLFHWVLNHTNNALCVKHEFFQWLGVLDIFGFESFDKNGIEQLCVNYANEKMQQYFIETYVESSRKDLGEEGFIKENNPLHTIDFYKERLNVIEEGLFLTLNDACHSPVPINISKIIQLACSNLYNGQKKFLDAKDGNFIIDHYSGPVAYSIDDLLSKNTDKVPNEISMIFNASTNKFLRTLINIDEEQYSHTIKTCRKRTMLAKLKYNIDTLIKELRKCDLHYVRCVKPNRLTDIEWDRKEFRKQLASTGIFDILPLAKCKYPIRLHYEKFCERYSKRPTETTDLNKCKLILESVVPQREISSLVHFGKQLIFLTESVFLKLEFHRRNYRIKCVNKIQMFWQKHSKYSFGFICLYFGNKILFIGQKNILVISKYLTTNDQIQDECETNKKCTSVKIMLDHELSKSSNSEDDDVFISNSDSPKDNNVTDLSDRVIISEQEVDVENTEEKLQHDIILTEHKYTLKELYRCDSNTDINYDANNNSLEQNEHKVLHSSLINGKCAVNTAKQKYPKHYDMVHMVEIGSFRFFYKNRILSRRRLANIPVKVHTRPTCLTNSHILPHYELPQGLQDCL
ncbi:LOW QUALITY PROTEIN: unconventional myosin-XIX [Megachile rotundata]|uniref:LOW QUALITY PROTEIN: unconventional myosin-XIX n=1 Tax=Megachile rotundata TaxID=143995 RepID=UPI003FD16374